MTFCSEVLRPKVALQGGSLGKNTFSLLCPAKALIGQTQQEAEGIGAWARLHAGQPPGVERGSKSQPSLVAASAGIFPLLGSLNYWEILPLSKPKFASL